MPENFLTRAQSFRISRNISKMVSAAHDAYNTSDDENAWYSVVNELLEFEVDEEAQSDQEDPFPKPYVSKFLVAWR